MNPYEPRNIPQSETPNIASLLFGIVVALVIGSFVTYGFAWSMNVLHNWYWEQPFEWYLRV